MADGKDRKPDAADTPRNDGVVKAKSPDEGGACAAKAGNAVEQERTHRFDRQRSRPPGHPRRDIGGHAADKP